MENDTVTSMAEVSEDTAAETVSEDTAAETVTETVSDNAVSETVLETVTEAVGETVDTAETAETTETTEHIGNALDGQYMGTVVLTGFFVVFVALVLLIFLVWLMDKVFSAIGGNSSKKDDGAKAADKSNSGSSKGSAMKVEKGISGEIVAAITAAIASLGNETGRKLRICGINKHDSSSSRGAWGNAAAVENTRSF